MPNRRMISSPALGIDRYRSGNIRAIPNTGPITATMIKNEWNHTGTFKLSADGASFINKTPSTNIKYSQFRGQSSVSGTLGPVNGPCKRDPRAVPAQADPNIFSNVGPCLATIGNRANCADAGLLVGSKYGGSAYIYRETYGIRVYGKITTGGSKGAMYVGNWCTAIGLDVELAPGTWEMVYDYVVQVGDRGSDKYNSRWCEVQVRLRMGAHNKDKGSKVAQANHRQTDECPPMGSCSLPSGPLQGTNRLRFTVTEGKQFPNVAVGLMTNGYRNSQNEEFKLRQLVKVG